MKLDEIGKTWKGKVGAGNVCPQLAWEYALDRQGYEGSTSQD